MRRIGFALGLIAVGVLALVGATVASSSPQHKMNDTVDLVAFSTPKAAYTQLISAFQQTPAGKNVDFTQSYGASGDQSRAVAAGQKADIVALSLASDIFPLISKGLVSNNWNKNKYNGMVTDSVVAFLVRKGNPKHIYGWGDLTRKGIQVLTPNPFTSGGARWNVIGAYGAKRRQGANDKQAIAYLNLLFHHVVAQDTSARNALTTFSQGKGDVLIDYESEALFADKNGVSSSYVIPKRTMLIENPIALTTSGENDPGAKAFLNFLRTDAAQKIWAENGYRPVIKRVFNQYKSTFPTPQGLFNIRQLGLGGWAKVQKRFFDPKTGLLVAIEKSVGGSVGG
jgi:sulfate/thiosulfate transport system substrate-binding protein